LPSRQLQKVKDRLMSKFYTAEHRALQDKFDTRRVAEMMENRMRTANSPNRCVRSSNLWTCSFFRPSTHLAGPLVLTRAVRPDLPQALIAGPETGGHSTRCDPATRIAKRSRTRAEKSPGKPTLICSPRERLRRGCVLADAKTSPGPIPAKLNNYRLTPVGS
jgi:hypothetical protein